MNECVSRSKSRQAPSRRRRFSDKLTRLCLRLWTRQSVLFRALARVLEVWCQVARIIFGWTNWPNAPDVPVYGWCPRPLVANQSRRIGNDT
jgi:hypothetical protein